MLLDVEGLEAGYGAATVLRAVSLSLDQGEALSLMGRNGMGKTTTIRALLGLLRPTAGRVRFAGVDVTGWPAHRIARLGVGLVPEGRRVFAGLSVMENLRATARPGPWSEEAVLALFPRLAERAGHGGGQLSGGEQQMLAIGRALMTNPRLLILDEATEGLAPLIRDEIWACLARVRAEGQAVIVVDKDRDALARLADRHAVMETGQIAWRGDTEALRREARIVEDLLSV
jgi:branched-chain amino acid transport system ATP-binding protein